MDPLDALITPPISGLSAGACPRRPSGDARGRVDQRRGKSGGELGGLSSRRIGIVLFPFFLFAGAALHACPRIGGALDSCLRQGIYRHGGGPPRRRRRRTTTRTPKRR